MVTTSSANRESNTHSSVDGWPTSGSTILVVDDEMMNRKLIEAILAGENSVIITAKDGAQALARVAETPPDLVLLDMMMPGMSGLQVLRKLKGDAVTAAIPVIMVTAMADRESIAQALDAGADECLTKPVNAAELMQRVRNILRVRQQ